MERDMLREGYAKRLEFATDMSDESFQYDANVTCDTVDLLLETEDSSGEIPKRYVTYRGDEASSVIERDFKRFEDNIIYTIKVLYEKNQKNEKEVYDITTTFSGSLYGDSGTSPVTSHYRLSREGDAINHATVASEDSTTYHEYISMSRGHIRELAAQLTLMMFMLNDG